MEKLRASETDSPESEARRMAEQAAREEEARNRSDYERDLALIRSEASPFDADGNLRVVEIPKAVRMGRRGPATSTSRPWMLFELGYELDYLAKLSKAARRTRRLSLDRQREALLNAAKDCQRNLLSILRIPETPENTSLVRPIPQDGEDVPIGQVHSAPNGPVVTRVEEDILWMAQRHSATRQRSFEGRKVNHSQIARDRASGLGLARALGSDVVTKAVAESARKAFRDHPLRQYFEGKRDRDGRPYGPRPKGTGKRVVR
jgi:hypothetical protein